MTNGPIPAPTEVLIGTLARWARPERVAAVRWGVALLAVLAALASGIAMGPFLPVGILWPAVLPAVLLAAAFAGTIQAVVVALACGLVARQLVPTPEAATLLLFALASGTGILLIHVLRRTLRLLSQAQARADAEAEQRAATFAELQHRVSNDLAVLGSLLSAQRREVADPAARRALDQAASRIEVVARLCRRLHDPEMQEIDFGEFLEAVVPDILTAHGAEGRIELRVQAENVVLPASKAVPLGLIAMELLSNAIEHGFPADAGGRVEVSLEGTGSLGARLLVWHDGLGLPHGFRLSEVRSPGLLAAKQLARQVGADLMIVQDRGVVACLCFPTSGRRRVPAEGRAEAPLSDEAGPRMSLGRRRGLAA